MNRYLPDEEIQPEGALWWTFTGQTRIGHVLVVLSGWGLWAAVYVLHLTRVGGSIELLVVGGPEALAARQAAITAATTACWLWFSLATMAGKGGPGLNISLYPLGALLFGPYLTALAIAGRSPPAVFTSADSPVSWTFLVDGLGLFMPGFLLSLVVLGVFLGVKTYVTGTIDAWEAKHMPAEWHEHRAKFETRE